MIILRFEVRVSFAQLSHVPIKTSSLMNSHKSPGQISLQLFLHLISTDLPSSAPRFPFIPPIPLCCLLKQSRGRLFKWSSLDWRAALSRWKPGTQTGLILKVERERERELRTLWGLWQTSWHMSAFSMITETCEVCVRLIREKRSKAFLFQYTAIKDSSCFSTLVSTWKVFRIWGHGLNLYTL